MKKFRYRLERVLSYREAVKAEKERALAVARRALEDARQLLAELENSLLQQSIAPGAVMNVGEIELLNNYVEGLRIRIAQQQLEIMNHEERVAQALEEYIEAYRDTESLIKHREKKKQEFTEYVEKENQKFLDELTTQRAGRR